MLGRYQCKNKNLLPDLDPSLTPKIVFKTQDIGLVFDYLENEDWKIQFDLFTLDDVRHYFYELFKAIHYTHSMGIIHRDIKPQNIIYSRSTKQLTLLDWGLAEFYMPNNPLKVRVASVSVLK